jgi:trafficking protein particle complex subunit 2
MHAAYYRSVSNPFVKLRSSNDDVTAITLAGGAQWKGFRLRVDQVAQAIGVPIQPVSA